MRVDDKASRAEIGKTRPLASFRNAPRLSPLAELLRASSLGRKKFSAIYRDVLIEGDSAFRITLESNPKYSRRVEIRLPCPTARGGNVFVDYRSGDSVLVEGALDPQCDPNKPRVLAEAIWRTQDPFGSRITALGREHAPPDFSEELRNWRAIQRKPEEHLGEKLRGVGVYRSVRQTPTARVLLDRLWMGYEANALLYQQTSEAAQFFSQLNSGDEILFEAVVLGGRSGSPNLALAEVIARADPAKRVAFQVPDPRKQVGAPIMKIDTHQPFIKAVAWSPPDGKHFAICSRRGQVALWDATSGEKLRTLQPGKSEADPFGRGVESLAFSPDGTRIAGVGRDAIFVWDLKGDSTPFLAARASRGVHGTTFQGGRSLSWSGDGEFLATDTDSVNDFGGTRLYVTASARSDRPTKFLTLRALSFRKEGIVAWSPTSGIIAFAGEQGCVVFFEVSDRTCAAKIALSPEAAIPWANPSTSRIQPESHVGIVRRPGGGCKALAWSPDGTLLAIAAARIEIWEYAEKPALRSQVLAPDDLREGFSSYLQFADVTWSPDSTQLAAVAGYKRIVVADAKTGDITRQFEASENVKHILWSPAGDRLATVEDSRGIVRLWRAKDDNPSRAAK